MIVRNVSKLGVCFFLFPSFVNIVIPYSFTLLDAVKVRRVSASGMGPRLISHA